MGRCLRKCFAIAAVVPILWVPIHGQNFEKKLSFAQTGIGYGARALALGGAFIAVADDITAMSYNPAGLAQLLRPEFSFGLSSTSQSYFLPQSDYTMDGTWDTYQDNASDIRYSFMRFEYAGGVLPMKIAGLPVVLGIGFQTKANERAKPEYEHDSEAGGGDYLLRELRTISGNEFGTMNVGTLSLAVRPAEFLHLGVNLNYWREKGVRYRTFLSHQSLYYAGSLWWEAYVTESSQEDLSITKGLNADLGVLLKFKAIAFGLVYKTSFALDYRSSYDRDFSLQQVGDGTLNQQEAWEAAGKIRWPYSLGAGISARPFDILTISADYTFSDWSEGQVVWETPPPDAESPQGYPVEAPRDIRQYRVGIEFLPLVRSRFAVAARAGWFSDQAYWSDLNGEPIGFKGLSFGAGLIMAHASIDLAAIHYSGSYAAAKYYVEEERQASWHILASFSFRFGN